MSSMSGLRANAQGGRNRNSWLPHLPIIQTMRNEMKLRFHRVETFQPKMKIDLTVGTSRVFTARHPQDLKRVLQFRYDVFFREAEMENKFRPQEFDVDEFDIRADHLIIEREHEIVGTYRILSSDYTDRFYSETEFHLESLLGLFGKKLELGRACVHPGHRAGVVINALWRGIGEYIRVVQPDYVFGCSSVKLTAPEHIFPVSQFLNRNHGDLDIRAFPRPRFQVGPVPLAILKSEPPCAGIPPLLQSYLNLGAKVCGEPALDLEFGCVDFLTVLRKENMDCTFENKYVKRQHDLMLSITDPRT